MIRRLRVLTRRQLHETSAEAATGAECFWEKTAGLLPSQCRGPQKSTQAHIRQHPGTARGCSVQGAVPGWIGGSRMSPTSTLPPPITHSHDSLWGSAWPPEAPQGLATCTHIGAESCSHPQAPQAPCRAPGFIQKDEDSEAPVFLLHTALRACHPTSEHLREHSLAHSTT